MSGAIQFPSVGAKISMTPNGLLVTIRQATKNKIVTGDFAFQMEGATMLSTSEFGEASKSNMK